MGLTRPTSNQLRLKFCREATARKGKGRHLQQSESLVADSPNTTVVQKPNRHLISNNTEFFA